MRRVLVLMLVIPALSSLAFTQNELIFRRNGAGLWVEEGRKSELIVIMEMRRQRGEQLTLTIRPINGIPRRFSGQVSTRDDSSYTVKITSSEKSNASGIIYVANATDQSVRFVIGHAEVDGRKVAFHFTKERPLRWNALSFGSGVLAEGDDRYEVELVSVLTNQRGESLVSLLMDNGTVRSFSASEPASQDSTQTDLKVTGAASSGTIKIGRNRAKHGIERIEGEVVADGLPISFSFAADR